MKKFAKSLVTGSGEPIAIDMDKSSVRMMGLFVYDLGGETGPSKEVSAARDPGKIMDEKRNALRELLQGRQQSK